MKGTGAGFAWGCCWRAFSQDRHLQLLKVWRHTGNYPSSLSPQQPLPPCHHMSLIYLWFLHFHSQAPAPPSSHLQTPSPVPLASQPGSATALLWQLHWGEAVEQPQEQLPRCTALSSMGQLVCGIWLHPRSGPSSQGCYLQTYHC